MNQLYQLNTQAIPKVRQLSIDLLLAKGSQLTLLCCPHHHHLLTAECNGNRVQQHLQKQKQQVQHEQPGQQAQPTDACLLNDSPIAIWQLPNMVLLLRNRLFCRSLG